MSDTYEFLKAQKDAILAKQEVERFAESGGYAPLAKVLGDKRSTMKDAQANAMLMAAAPELLAACKNLLDVCYDLEINDETVAAVATARAAIAKATGGEV